MQGQVAEPEKDDRLQRLQALLAAQQAEFNASSVGRTLPVLFEKPGRHAGQIIGRSPYLQGVHVTAPQSLIGRIAAVAITRAERNSLAGALAHTPVLEPA
jgi:tRNA-2-methylthio-N6-dimethylallyladenosine synthase